MVPAPAAAVEPNKTRAIAARAQAAIQAAQAAVAKSQQVQAEINAAQEERSERSNYYAYGENIGQILHNINKATNKNWGTAGRRIRNRDTLRISNTTRRRLARTYLRKIRSLHGDNRNLTEEELTNFLASGGARTRKHHHTKRRASRRRPTQPKRRTRKH
jgi:isocitrate dehydrogenase kinase/phosphatase